MKRFLKNTSLSLEDNVHIFVNSIQLFYTNMLGAIMNNLGRMFLYIYPHSRLKVYQTSNHVDQINFCGHLI